nr:hypothetical protein Q903MT_gene1357 [Picea sitchensis]
MARADRRRFCHHSRYGLSCAATPMSVRRTTGTNQLPCFIGSDQRRSGTPHSLHLIVCVICVPTTFFIQSRPASTPSPSEPTSGLAFSS